MKLKIICGAVLGLALGFGLGAGSSDNASSVSIDGLFALGISTAHAQRGRARRGRARRHTRRVVRRTARRTTRRVVRRTTIAGCLAWRTYWNCGGVYYRPVIEDGVTVYVEVNL